MFCGPKTYDNTFISGYAKTITSHNDDANISFYH